MSGSGAHWPGEACHTVWAELLKPLELDVLFHPGCRGSLVLKQPFLSIQEDTRVTQTTHGDLGSLGTTRRGQGWNCPHLGGVGKWLCWASGALQGSTWEVAFHPTAFQRQGPSTQSSSQPHSRTVGKQQGCLDQLHDLGAGNFQRKPRSC